MVQSDSLRGRTALITGATSGIGRAIAEAYAAAGAHVAVSGRDAARGAEVVEGIRASGGKADFVAADLGASIERISVKATTSEKLGFTGRGEGIAAHAVVLIERA
jgi:NAD(P)-dependent dehydrogenase (short-subunit alcohol dehydrogenase family)